MSNLYPGLVQLDEPIPVHLTSRMSLKKVNDLFFHLDKSLIEDLFGSMMTYLEKDILPFPHLNRIDLGPAMKRKVFHFVR